MNRKIFNNQENTYPSISDNPQYADIMVSPKAKVESTQSTLIEDFESNSLGSDWTVNRFGTGTYQPFQGTYIATENTTGGTDPKLATYSPTELDGGKKISKLTYYWRESSNSSGGGMRIMDSSGNTIGAFLSDNPQWVVQIGQDSTKDSSFDVLDERTNSNYNVWIEVTLEFDYSNNQITYTGKDMSTGNSTTATYTSVNSLNDVRSFDFMMFAYDGSIADHYATEYSGGFDFTFDMSFDKFSYTG